MSNELVVPTVNFGELLNVNTGELAALKDIASSRFIPYMRLFSGGAEVLQGNVPAGTYGSPQSDGKILSFGKTVDLIPVAMRPMAMRTEGGQTIVTYDVSSDLFKQIEAAANVKGGGSDMNPNKHGPVYLFFEKSSKKFYTLFGYTASWKRVHADIADALPGQFGGKGPNPLTLSSKWVEVKSAKGDFAWWAPVVSPAAGGFSAIGEEALAVFNEGALATAQKFLDEKGTEVEVAPPAAATGGRKR